MMDLKGVFTDRHYQDWPSWHIVYEWEDELSHALHLPLKNSPEGSKHVLYNMFKHIDHKVLETRAVVSILKCVPNDIKAFPTAGERFR